jgi:parallel beta-helix repeat protein
MRRLPHAANAAPALHRPGAAPLLAALLAVSIGALPARTAAAATTVYVNNTGPACSDAGPGTPASPYCTLSAALAAHHAAGDSILVLPGVYREQVTVPASGDPGSPIVLLALSSPGKPVVVDGADDFGDPALWVPHSGDVWLATSVTWNPKQVFVDSVRLTPASGGPGSLTTNSFVWVAGQGLYVSAGGFDPGDHQAEVGHRSFGFLASGRSWLVFDGFETTRSEFAGFELTNSSNNITVTHNAARFSKAYGIQAENCAAVLIGSNVASDNLSSGIALTAGSTGCTLQDNESYRNLTPSQSAGIYAFGSPANLIQRNRLHDNAYHGIVLTAGATDNVLLQNRSWNNAQHGFEDIFSTGNTHIGDDAYGNGSYGFAIEGGATGTTLSDCVATDNGGASLEVDASSSSEFTSNDNLFWRAAGGTVVKFGGVSYPSVPAYSAASGRDTRTLQVDPRFANPAGGDFRPTVVSPLIDAANSDVPNWPATDAAGNARTDAPATANTGLGPVAYADRGALEFQPDDPPPPPPNTPGTYYVDDSGASCSNVGPGTPANPFCTISAALGRQHAPGTTLVVMPGVYREQVTVPASGEPGNPIVLQGQGMPGDPVVLDGADDFADPAKWIPFTGEVWLAVSVTWSPRQVLADSVRLALSTAAPAALPANSFVWVAGQGLYVNVRGDNPGHHHAEVGNRAYGIFASGRSWLAFDGFTTTRSELAGFEFTNLSRNITVTHAAATFSAGYGIQANNSSAIRIGSSLACDNLSSGIALTAGSTGCIVEVNESCRNLTPGLSAGIYAYASPDNRIQHNRLHDNAYTGLHTQNLSGVLSIQNRSWSNGADGFHDVASTGTAHIGDVAYRNFRDGFRLDSGCAGATLGNCIGTVNGLVGSGYDLRVDSTSTTGLVSNDNLFWNPSGRPPVRYGATSHSSLAAFGEATGRDTRSIQADPRFADPDNGDFRLTWGSPAIDNANSGVPNWPATDAAGGSRLDDPATANTGLGPVAHADRGALEYEPAAPPPAATVPHLEHVIVVVVENKSYTAARGAPYIDALATANASFSECYAITHPSQPNYFALWAGDTQGIVNDNCPPSGAPYSTANLGHACEAAGLSWRSYAEDLPTPGSTVCDAGHTLDEPFYTRRHAPWVSFANVNHANEQTYPQLVADIAAGSLPNLAFVIPNNCHNAHDCPLDSTDAWLARELPVMLSAVGPNGLVILTCDEDDDQDGNRILTVLAGPLVRPGALSHRFVNHHALLRTICDGLGLASFGAAVTELPITDVWREQTLGVRNPPRAGGTKATVGLGRPNPFHASTSVSLTLPSPTTVSAEVYDLAGRRVKTLATAQLSGVSEIHWDGSRDDGGPAHPGVYLVRVRAGGAQFTRRVVRLR